MVLHVKHETTLLAEKVKNENKGRQIKVRCYMYKHCLLKDRGLCIQKNMIVMYYVFIYTSLCLYK